MVEFVKRDNACFDLDTECELCKHTESKYEIKPVELESGECIHAKFSKSLLDKIYQFAKETNVD